MDFRRTRPSDGTANYKETSVRAANLIGHFAGMQISASESLREATLEGLSREDRLRRLERAKADSASALELASNELERALAFSQLTRATGMIALVELGIKTQRVE